MPSGKTTGDEEQEESPPVDVPTEELVAAAAEEEDITGDEPAMSLLAARSAATDDNNNNDDDTNEEDILEEVDTAKAAKPQTSLAAAAAQDESLTTTDIQEPLDASTAGNQGVNSARDRAAEVNHDAVSRIRHGSQEESARIPPAAAAAALPTESTPPLAPVFATLPGAVAVDGPSSSSSRSGSQTRSLPSSLLLSRNSRDKEAPNQYLRQNNDSNNNNNNNALRQDNHRNPPLPPRVARSPPVRISTDTTNASEATTNSNYTNTTDNSYDSHDQEQQYPKGELRPAETTHVPFAAASLASPTVTVAAAAIHNENSVLDVDGTNAMETSLPLPSPPTETEQTVVEQPALLASSLPVADEYYEPSSVEALSAEVVVPPVTGVEVYQVDFDHPVDEEQARQGSATSPRSNGNVDNNNNPSRSKPSLWDANRRIILTFAICICLLLIGIIIAISIGVAENNRSNNKASKDDNALATTSPPTYEYACFSSTLDILSVQVELDAAAFAAIQPMVVCPNTRIHLGTFRNPSRNDFNITGGDFPLSVMRANMTLQCGIDGRRGNNCVLDGGIVQVVGNVNHWHPQYGYNIPDPETDNVVIRGMTFSGQIQSSGVFGGIGVALSHPGKNMRFEDCAWVDFTATRRLVAVGQNYLMELMGLEIPNLSVELTISNCLFDNVSYEEEFLISFQQALHVENSVFRDIRLASLLTAGCSIHTNGCRGLMHCKTGDGPNVCSLSNVCVENFEAMGAGPIIVSHDTNFTNYGNNTWYGAVETFPSTDLDEAQQYGMGTAADSSMRVSPFCALGIAWMDESTMFGETYQCRGPVFEAKASGTCL